MHETEKSLMNMCMKLYNNESIVYLCIYIINQKINENIL
jgi:hypothetical protein